MFAPSSRAASASAMRLLQPLRAASWYCPAQEDVADVGLDRVGGDDHAFDQLVRIAFEQQRGP